MLKSEINNSYDVNVKKITLFQGSTHPKKKKKPIKDCHVIPHKTNKGIVGQQTNTNVRLFQIKFDHHSVITRLPIKPQKGSN